MSKKVNEAYDLGTSEWDDFILKPLKIIKMVFVVYSLCVFLVPMYKGSSLGMDSFISFICWVVMLGGCLSCHGRLFDFLPLTFIAGIRTIQICFYIFIKHGSINIWTTLIVLGVEFILNMLYISDKSSYTYIKEEENVDEYY